MFELPCFSDTHGTPPPNINEDSAAAWLFAGDFYNGPESENSPTTTDDPATKLLYPASSWIEQRGIPVLALHGNHDVCDPWRFFSRENCVDGAVTRLADNLLVAGIGWHGERYFEIPLESDLEPLCDSVRRQVLLMANSRDLIVLMTHYPPRLPEVFSGGEYENPGWYQSLRQLAEDLRPVAIIQGHNHHWHGQLGTVNFGGRECLCVQPGPEGMRLSIGSDEAQLPKIVFRSLAP
jgi:Icc-related predicted phosphoesterase